MSFDVFLSTYNNNKKERFYNSSLFSIIHHPPKRVDHGNQEILIYLFSYLSIYLFPNKLSYKFGEADVGLGAGMRALGVGKISKARHFKVDEGKKFPLGGMVGERLRLRDMSKKG